MFGIVKVVFGCCCLW